MSNIKTTHVGSLPRSNELSDLLFKKDQKEKIDLNQFDEIVQRDVENITSIVLEKITSTLENEGRVEIRGFGSLSVRRRRSKNGRNPRTGESVFVPEKKAPIFKSGKGLRDRLNYKT